MQTMKVERNLRLIQFKIENENWKILPQLSFPESVKNKVEDFFKEYRSKSNFAAVAPGSVWKTKIYPDGYYLQVIEYLAQKFDFVFLIGSEKDRMFCEEIARKFGKNVKSVAGNFTIMESIYFLKHMKLLISNDSAPAHFGMCVDIPVLMLYCSTVPDFGFYPYNKKSYFLSFDDLNCKPCGIHGFNECPLNHFNCGYKLVPESVITKIKEMING